MIYQNKAIRTIAGILFLVCAICYLFINLNDYKRNTLLNIVFVVGFAVIAASYFLQRPALISLGSFVCIVSCMVSVVRIIMWLHTFPYTPSRQISTYPKERYLLDLGITIIMIVFFILLVIIGIKPKKQRLLWFIAFGLLLIRAVVIFILSYYPSLFITSDFQQNIFLLITTLLLGVYANKETGKPDLIAEDLETSVELDSFEDKMELLTKLKELHDKEIITQEEYETKKKQILGK